MPHGTLFVVICPPPQSLPPIPASNPSQTPISRTGLAVPASSPSQRPFSRTSLAVPASNPCQKSFSRTGLAIPASSPCQRPFSRTGLAIPASSPYQRPFSRTSFAVPASGSQKTMLTALSDHSFVQRGTGPVQLFAATQVFRLKFLHRRKFFATKPCVVAVINPGAVAREC